MSLQNSKEILVTINDASNIQLNTQGELLSEINHEDHNCSQDLASLKSSISNKNGLKIQIPNQPLSNKTSLNKLPDLDPDASENEDIVEKTPLPRQLNLPKSDSVSHDPACLTQGRTSQVMHTQCQFDPSMLDQLKEELKEEMEIYVEGQLGNFLALDEADEYIEDQVVDNLDRQKEELELKMKEGTQRLEELIKNSIEELNLELQVKI